MTAPKMTGPQTTGTPDEWPTLREAASRLGVSKRTLERRLAKGDLPQARRVNGEWRLPPGEDAPTEGADAADRGLSGVSEAVGGPVGGSVGDVGGENRDSVGGVGGGVGVVGAVSEGHVGGVGTLPAALYHKIIADKDGEIAFLRAQLHQAQQNLAREQTLRALPAPMEASQNSPADAQGRTEAGAGGDSVVTAGPGDTQRPAEAKRAGWWQRLWGKG